MEFTLADLAAYLKTQPHHVEAACIEAGVGLRWRAVPGRRGLKGECLPLTAAEARDVIRAYRMRKAIRKVRKRFG